MSVILTVVTYEIVVNMPKLSKFLPLTYKTRKTYLINTPSLIRTS